MQAQKCELARGHVILLADILKLFVCVCVCVCVCVWRVSQIAAFPTTGIVVWIT